MKIKIICAAFLCALFIIVVNFQPKFYYNRGKVLYERGNFEEALNYFQKALILHPDNVDYRYYIVKSLSELKPSYRVQKWMYEFASGSKDDGAKILANDKIFEWKANINQNIGSNYIEQAPSDSKIIRWNKNSFPLKIYVNDSALSNLPDYYKSAVSRAFSQWENSVDFVSFVNTNKKSDAQILISFEKLPVNVCNEGICKYVVGFTTPKISGNTLKGMKIVIYDKNPKGEFFSDKEIYNTVLHELGHALGIMGHSYSTDDLMYMQNQEQSSLFAQFRSDFQYLSGNDVNTLRLLYMLEPDITDKPAGKNDLIYSPVLLGSPEEIAAKKVDEALDYIKSSPELSVGYINLAGAYTDLKEYKKALNALQNALDIANNENELYIIYYNFAYIYMHLKSYNIALQYAELARNIQQSSDILELIGVIKNNQNVK